jgi:hypothetical protein
MAAAATATVDPTAPFAPAIIKSSDLAFEGSGMDMAMTPLFRLIEINRKKPSCPLLSKI